MFNLRANKDLITFDWFNVYRFAGGASDLLSSNKMTNKTVYYSALLSISSNLVIIPPPTRLYFLSSFHTYVHRLLYSLRSSTGIRLHTPKIRTLTGDRASSSSHWYLSSYPKTRTLTGDRAFSSSAPCFWNNLPAEDRGITNLT